MMRMRSQLPPRDGGYSVAFCWNEVALNKTLDILRAEYPAGYDSLSDAIRNPLVVIDPEDAEQVERLVTLFADRWGYDESTTIMQAALRDFANPTPPLAEPKGLGAVVEDIEGVRWTRVESGEAETRNPWYPADCEEQPNEWLEIDAVKVLSEGVTP